MRNLLILIAVLLAACARPVFEPEGAALELTPRDAAADIAAFQGRRVIWGGEIVQSSNLAESTELVILGRSLQRSQRPRGGGEPLGRFIARYPGYLETVTFAPGRLVTIPGIIEQIEIRPVGEADYRYPVMRAEAVHLWDEAREGGMRFGIGVGISR